MKHKILVIDDEPFNLTIVEMMLSDSGFELITAQDGAQGWDILLEHYRDISVVITDRMMPNMDGMELVAKIKLHSEMANIPIIMQSAAAQKKAIEEGLQAGVFYYLAKPYSSDKLISVVDSAVQYYQAQANK